MAHHCYDECHYAECRILFIIMLNVIMLSVVAPSLPVSTTNRTQTLDLVRIRQVVYLCATVGSLRDYR
jgi:hypothetical protein